MRAGVPQFIDIEDKIAFGLTAKQLLWLGAAVALLVASYSFFDRQLFFIVGAFIVLIFGSLAFVRPQEVSLLTFAGFTLMYLLKPKNYIWKRVWRRESLDIKKAVLARKNEAPLPIAKKNLPGRSQLKKIAWELDTKK